MQQWKQSVEKQLANMSQAVTPAQASSPGGCKAALIAVSKTPNPHSTDVSFPDSGFPSTDRQAAQEDSVLSSGTADSLKTVRSLSPVHSGCAVSSNEVDSADCSLLEQYLSSVQQREEEAEDVNSDGTETPQPSSPSKSAKSNSPLQKEADNQLEVQRTGGNRTDPE